MIDNQRSIKGNIEVNNLTYAFIKPSRRFHCCENFWSSLFALQIIQLSNTINRNVIETYEYHQDDTGWKFTKNGEYLIEKGLNINNVIVDGKIKDRFIDDLQVPYDKFNDLRPDVTIIGEKSIDLFEIKTIGANVSNKELWYKDFEKHCSQFGYTVRSFLVVSAGSEDKGIWKLVRESSDWQGPKNIIILEQFVRNAIDTMNNDMSIFKLALPNIEEYCNVPLSGN